jgi:hypothetical protein
VANSPNRNLSLNRSLGTRVASPVNLKVVSLRAASLRGIRP